MGRAKLNGMESIPKVINDLTLDEKLNLIGAYRACETLEIPDMDIPKLRMMDGATGVNATHPAFNFATSPENAGENLFLRIPELAEYNYKDINEAKEQRHDDPVLQKYLSEIEILRPNGKQFVSFPSGINIGSGFNTALGEKIGEAIGKEMRESKVDICFGPNVDIARDPLGGRNYEMYGEDPQLVGQMGTAVIKGIQAAGTAACAKHFLANNQETNRNTKDTHLSERTLREIHAVGFEYAVKKGEVDVVMSAYNAINGEFTSFSHRLLTELLRDEWGFKGVTCCDWGACTNDKDKAILAGMGLIINGPNDMSQAKAAVLDGTLPEGYVDARVYDILKLIVKLQERRREVPAAYDQKEILSTCMDVIADGAVLLKNDHHVLPLPKNAGIAFYGERSRNFMEFGTGSTAVGTALHSNVYDSTIAKYPQADVCFEKMEQADTVIYTVTAPAGENTDRKVMDIEEQDRKRIAAVLREAKENGKKTVVILNVAGPVDVRAWEPYADSILCIFLPGCMGGETCAELLFGDRFPGGKLTVTFPERYADTPNFPNFPGEYNDVYYGEGIFVGYRSYEMRDLPVKYPFGFGLSYTNFSLQTDVDAMQWDLEKENSIKIPVTVTNTGDRIGSEVVQIYISEVHPHVLRPRKELAGFAKATLAPGETKTVEVELEKDMIRYWDQEKGKWIYPVGEGTLYVGNASNSIVKTIALETKGTNAYALGPNSVLGEIFADPRAEEIVNKYTGDMLKNMSLENRSFMVNTPLSEYLGFMIAIIPDAVQLDSIRQKIYQELAEL